MPAPADGVVVFPNLDSIRDQRLLQSDADEVLTEITSRTDDEVVRDAFKFLDGSDREAEVDDEEEQEDEIVYLR